MSAYMDVPVPNMCRPKHQILILKTYPKFQKNQADVKPNPSELSYLLYYVSTRRSKLQKVGLFLERRAQRDVYKRRIGNLQVTLEICRALIEKCPRDLNLYAFHILSILRHIITSKDVNLIEETIPCWDIFCANHDGANLAADTQYVKLFEQVIREYALCASPPDPPTAADGHVELRWRSVGLRAIRSVCASDALGSAANAKQQLAIVLPIILRNIYSEDTDHLDELQYYHSQHSHRLGGIAGLKQNTAATTGGPVLNITASTTATEVDEEKRNALAPRTSIGTIDGAMANTAADADKLEQQDIEILALHSLKSIFEVNNTAQIRFATDALLNHVTTVPAVAEVWITSLIEMVAKWCPMQARFLILVEILETLVACPMTESQLPKQLVCTQLISWLLSSTVNLVGLSVMDVLVSIIAKILQLLQLEAAPPHTQGQSSSVAAPANNGVASTSSTNGGLVAGTQSAAPGEAASSAVAAIFSITATITQVVKSPSSVRKDLLHKLRACIADLATHIYYSDQIADITSEILLRLKPTPSSPVTTDPAVAAAATALTTGGGIGGTVLTEHPHVDDFFSFDTARAIALKSVRDLLQVANQRTQQQSIGRNTVPFSVWEGTHWLLREEEKGVRKAYVDALATYLAIEIDRPNTNSDIATALVEINSLNLSSRGIRLVNSSFLKLLHVCAYESLLAYAGTATDVVGMYKLLDLLVRKMGLPAVLSGLPMIYKLDEEAAGLETAKRKIAIKSIVLAYIYSVADTWSIEPLRTETSNTIMERKNAGKWFVPLKVPREDGVAGDMVDVFDEKHVYPESLTDEDNNGGGGVLLPREDYDNIVEVLTAAVSAESEAKFPAQLRDIFDAGKHWNKEAVLATVEAHGSRQTSLSESQRGNGAGGMGAQTGTIRSFLTVNGERRSLHTRGGEGKDAQRSSSSRPPTGNLEKFRVGRDERYNRANRSLTNLSTARSSSSRESTVRADELKRVLSGAVRAGAGSSRPNTRSGSLRFANRISVGSAGGHSDASSDSMMDLGSFVGSSDDDLSTHGRFGAGAASTPKISSRGQSPMLQHSNSNASNGTKRRAGGILRSRSTERKGAAGGSPMPPENKDDEKPPVPPLPGLYHSQLGLGVVGGHGIHMPGEFPATPPPITTTTAVPAASSSSAGAARKGRDDGLASFTFWDEDNKNIIRQLPEVAGVEGAAPRGTTVTTSPTGAPQIEIPISTSNSVQGTPQKAWWENDLSSKYSPSVTLAGSGSAEPSRTPEPRADQGSPTRAVSRGDARNASSSPSPVFHPPVVGITEVAIPTSADREGRPTTAVDVKGLLSGIGSLNRAKSRERSGSTLSGGFRPPY